MNVNQTANDRELIPMGKSSDEYLFETYMHEYDKHRDEIQNRIGLQNGMVQRGIYLTGLTITVLVTLFTFFMKDYSNDVSSQDAQKSITLFWAVCIPVLLTHRFLILLTIATWIYQLSMIFRIVRYWNWIVGTRLEPIIRRPRETFLWDRVQCPPWDMALDRFPIAYFQQIFLYLLSMFSFFSLLLALIWQPSDETAAFATLKYIGWIGLGILAALLVGVMIIHTLVLKGTEATKDVTVQKSSEA